MLVVGDAEESEGLVALRRHREGDRGALAVEEAARRLAGEVAARAHD
jgi:hypothetical protein